MQLLKGAVALSAVLYRVHDVELILVPAGELAPSSNTCITYYGIIKLDFAFHVRNVL